MSNFLIVLFKNKKKKKIIKGYQTEIRAMEKYNDLLQNNKFYFDVQYENAERSKYELAVLTNKDPLQRPIYQVDELGRNEKVFLESDSDYKIRVISPYHIEEKIYDWRTDTRITMLELVNKYLPKNEMKSISTLHNKLIVQINDIFYLFSLKNIQDANRLLDSLQTYFKDSSRSDSIFVRDTSTTQRKWLYDLLIEKGFDKQKLYRQSTTFSKRK